jgi:starch phosphorylase
LLKCNPELASLITDKIGAGWVKNLDELEGLAPYAKNPQFQRDFRAIKQANKRRLAAALAAQHDIPLNPEFILDSQVKRLHEYKRQLLNILHVVALYLKYKQEPSLAVIPRTFLFAGKAAPGYETAKRVIHLINSVGDIVNNDPQVKDKLQVVFVPNYNVTWAELIMPATEVSEQISTAGMEASGTGNMKFALNGALTIGTLDGANIEIREAVGAENFFLFGLTAEQVEATRAKGYDPQHIYYSERPVREAVDAIKHGMFSRGLGDRFQPVIDSLLGGDYYLILADFLGYMSCHEAVLTAYADPVGWNEKAIINVARMGPFSSDRTIMGYSSEIWGTRAATPPVAAE